MPKKSKGIAVAERFAKGSRSRKDLDKTRKGSSLSKRESTQAFNQGVNKEIDRITGSKSVGVKFKKNPWKF